MRHRTFDGAALRAARIRAGYSQQAFAAKAGVSRSYVKYVENGTTQPSDIYADALAAALDLYADDLSSPKSVAA